MPSARTEDSPTSNLGETVQTRDSYRDSQRKAHTEERAHGEAGDQYLKAEFQSRTVASEGTEGGTGPVKGRDTCRANSSLLSPRPEIVSEEHTLNTESEEVWTGQRKREKLGSPSRLNAKEENVKSRSLETEKNDVFSRLNKEDSKVRTKAIKREKADSHSALIIYAEDINSNRGQPRESLCKIE
ncbi:unnamed protein product [Nippostrongylus brasiliensis]|uniref:Uncharacterized protein n=1 Tax=Nippostrongylus brasiliensis TaxID=27835 RepID=A0A0N4XFK1_NIPBR|nr:unnamed protein product [Nippostrongylus brasiliensis]